MRLWELFEDITAADIEGVERELDANVYQPDDKLKKNQPVLDLELPTGSAHFMQRILQRAAKANITPSQIKGVLKRAKNDPAFGYAQKIDRLSAAERPNTDLVVQDPNNLTIPLIVKPNPDCRASSPGSTTCVTRQGTKAPKNQIVAKTIFRKGVED